MIRSQTTSLLSKDRGGTSLLEGRGGVLSLPHSGVISLGDTRTGTEDTTTPRHSTRSPDISAVNLVAKLGQGGYFPA